MNKQQLEANTKKLTKRYKRIFLLRYSLVGLFFVNLYWFLMLLLSQSWAALIPILLLVLAGIAYSEQLKFANSSKDNYLLKRNKIYFKVQSIAMIILFLSLFNRLTLNVFFPFLNFNIRLNVILGIAFVLGIILSLFCIKRITNIANNKDKYYLKYKKQ